MKKKIIAVIIVASVISLPVLGISMGRTYNVNIKQAMDLAVENSSQKALDDLNIGMQEVNLREALFVAERPDSGTPLEKVWKEDIEPIKVEGDLETAKRTKEDNIGKTRLDAYMASLDMILANRNRTKEQQKLDIMKEKYQMAKVQLEQGRITEIDLLDMEFEVDNKNLDVENAAQKQEATYLELKRVLNVDIAQDDVILEDVIAFEGMKEINVKDLFVDVKGNITSIYAKEQNMKIQEKNFTETQRLSVNNEYEYEMAKFDFETAKYEFDSEKVKLDVDMQNKYNELLNQKESAELAIKFSELMNKQFEIEKLKFEYGVSSREDILNIQEKKLDADYQKISAIIDFLFKKAEFENLTKYSVD